MPEHSQKTLVNIRKNIDQIVSLGGWCQTRFQIERVFGTSWSSPYDWLVTPFRALFSTLEDRGSRFAQSFSAWDSGTDVICNKYGLLYHHEFPRNENQTIQFDAPTIATCREKMLCKMESLIEKSSGTRALFIRFGGQIEDPRAWPYRSDKEPIKTSDLNRLHTLLSKLTSRDEVYLAFVYHPEYTRFKMDEPANCNIIIHAFQQVGLEEVPIDGWKGNNKNWDSFFLECDKRLGQAALRR